MPISEKETYRISANMTKEKMAAKKDIITDAQIGSAEYHTRIDSEPDMSLLPPYCFFRYRGQGDAMETEDFFEASLTITQEKMNEKRGQISECAWLTAQYLKRLHKAPDRDVNLREKRYRG